MTIQLNTGAKMTNGIKRVLLLFFSLSLFLYPEICIGQSKRAVVPSQAEQEAANARVSTAFSKERKNAVTSELKNSLAQSYFDLAIESADGIPEQYVLLSLSRESAVEAGCVSLALECIEKLDERFELNSTELRCDTLERLLKTSKNDERQFLLASVEELIGIARRVDDYERAIRLNNMAEQLARTLNVKAQLKDISSRMKTLLEEKELYEEVFKAELNDDPKNKSISTARGKYKCFVKNDWESGLEHLRLSDDKVLNALANAEASETSDKVKLANDWWDFSDSAIGVSKIGSRSRAVHWYELLLPDMRGVDRKLAQERLNDQSVLLLNDMNQASSSSIISLSNTRTELRGLKYVFPSSDDKLSWRMIHGKEQSVRIIGKQLNIISPQQTSIEFPIEAKDGIVRTKLNLIRGGSFYIEMRASEKEGYSVILHKDGKLTFGRYSSYGFVPIQTFPKAIPRGVFLFQTEISGDQISIWINGIKIIAIKDSKVTQSGYVRFGINENAHVQIDSIQISVLE